MIKIGSEAFFIDIPKQWGSDNSSWAKRVSILGKLNTKVTIASKANFTDGSDAYLCHSEEFNGMGHASTRFESTVKNITISYEHNRANAIWLSEDCLVFEHQLLTCQLCGNPHERKPYEQAVSYQREHGRNISLKRILTACDPCLSHLKICSNCHTLQPEDGFKNLEGTGEYCAKCLARYAVNCAACDRTIHRMNARSYSSEMYCRSCFEERFFTCGRCANARRIETAETYDGISYCSHCATKHVPCVSDTFETNKDERMVGVEIEFLSLSSEVPKLDGLGITKDDASIHGKGKGIEINTRPANGDRLLRNIDTICEKIKEVKGYVNKTCGLHVHLDMKKTKYTGQRANIFRAFSSFEESIHAMVSKDRRENRYCRPIPNGLNYEDFMGDRYRSLNVSALSKYGTMEVRLHQGTVDPQKIKTWVLFLLSFFRSFKKLKLTDRQLDEIRDMELRGKTSLLFQMIDLPMKYKKKLVKRIRLYGSEIPRRDPKKPTKKAGDYRV